MNKILAVIDMQNDFIEIIADKTPTFRYGECQ